MSPRRTVRVYAVDASGAVVNSCPSTAYLGQGMPSTTWAMNAAGTDGLYRFLPFDLDAKTPEAEGQVPRDLRTLTGLLDELAIAYLVCASGPSGGRHVWVGLADPQPADLVHELAVLAKDLCPTLDLAPLSNPVTGCVRPPGAPHRSGGASVPLEGSLQVLEAPSTTAADVRVLLERLSTLAAGKVVSAAALAPTVLPVDEHDHPYLPGQRRDLSPAVRAVLEAVPPADSSAAAWTVLLGAAVARWRHRDVAVLVEEGWPGLEHLRTLRGAVGRLPRPTRGQNSPAGLLRRQWAKAVREVAARGYKGADATYEARAFAIAEHVRAIQDRADASAGRWHHGAGPSDRRVLDVLCTIALDAVTARTAVAIRRLGLLAGISRETARTSLLRLAQDGWIALAGEAEGANGATWSIDPRNVLHRELDPDLSLADTPRGSAHRGSLLRKLTARITASRHDVYTHQGALGLRTGNLYARLTTAPLPPSTLSTVLGAPTAWTERRLQVLQLYGLARNGPDGWSLPRVDLRDAVAEKLGVAGRLEERRRRYAIERELWDWWRAEEAWMRVPPAQRSRRRPGESALALVPDVGSNRHGAHPRRADGTRDFAAARRIIVDGVAPPPRSPRAKRVTGPVKLTAADRRVISILGATFVGTELLEAANEADSLLDVAGGIGQAAFASSSA